MAPRYEHPAIARPCSALSAVYQREPCLLSGPQCKLASWLPQRKDEYVFDIKKKTTGVALAAALITGGVIGGSILNAGAATTTSTTPAASTAPAGPNTDPAHEASENAAHAADEASGKFPGNGGKFVPNTNPAHEKAESASHAAQEAAGQVPTAP
jgi:hypothetical protein